MHISVTWLIHISVTWLIRMWDMTHQIWDMTHQIWDMTHSDTCNMTHSYKCNMTHSTTRLFSKWDPHLPRTYYIRVEVSQMRTIRFWYLQIRLFLKLDFHNTALFEIRSASVTCADYTRFWYLQHDSFIYVWHDSFICGTWLIHMRAMTHSYVWHDSDSDTCNMTHSYKCNMTHSYAGHDSFICGPWLIHIWDMTQLIPATWLIHISV